MTKLSLGLAAFALLSVAASWGDRDEERSSDHGWETIVIDVACDGRTMTLNSPGPATGAPIRGTTFIVNGKIYPGGTIEPGGIPLVQPGPFDLDTAPGALGTWICRGTFNMSIAEIMAGHGEEGPIRHVATTQHYLFGDGDHALMSEGQEGGTVRRVVLGGTGLYRGLIGEVKEEGLGANKTGFPNLRFTFKVRKQGPQRD